ncbi:MAG: tryptophan--tRNA ligase [Clostridiaceae bacterium]|nr:tryptophan--tRNA ligase [Clostridiaceae bacterium]
MPEHSDERKKIVLSGIQPSGQQFTLGNYIGAIRNWAAMQEQFDCLYMVANLHSLTVRQDPAALRQNTLRALASLLAAGIDPKRSVLFIQSQVPAHAELAWILNCYAMFGELSRMTQFKDKSARNADNINAGLFTYPALMAADILLYQADYVPVGADQKQHVEIARDIAARFNSIYGQTFLLPEPYIPAMGAKIMSLAEPERKMSKSDPNPNSCIYVMDKPEDIIRKFKRAVTDSDMQVHRGEGKDGVNNLITIYSIAAGITPEETECRFEGKGYGDFKLACGEAVAEMLRPFREKVEDLLKNRDYLDQIQREGAERAAALAARTLGKAQKKTGLLPRP